LSSHQKLQDSIKRTKEEIDELLTFSKNEIKEFSSYSQNEIKNFAYSINHFYECRFNDPFIS